MLLAGLGQSKREIALHLMREANLTLGGLADRLGISREAVRVQINEMIHEGWVAREELPRRVGKAGRPATLYRLTADGQHLFPKHYDALANQLLEALQEQEGGAPVHRLLASLTERNLRAWQRRLDGLSLEARLVALKSLYMPDDPFTELERSGTDWRLIERNCLFRNVALQHPVLCSSTVNLLTRLLGVRVVREQRIQDGANCCAFRIQTGLPCRLEGFVLEPEHPAQSVAPA